MERYRPRRRTRQLDLFGPEAPDAEPVWTEMSPETRQELTELMTRMFLESVNPAEREARADDA